MGRWGRATPLGVWLAVALPALADPPPAGGDAAAPGDTPAPSPDAAPPGDGPAPEVAAPEAAPPSDVPATEVAAPDAAAVAPAQRLGEADGQRVDGDDASPSGESPSAEITVSAPAARPAEPVQFVLSAEVLAELPGSAGDAVRAVQNLPGVGRAPLGLGQLIIRGLGPEVSRYSVDGVDVPLVFHFAGVTTLIPTQALADVTYLPGGYGVRYGRGLGGRVELRTSDALPDGHHGSASLDVFQGSLWAAMRASPRTGLWVSLRRSWIDSVLTPLLSTPDVQRRFPRYYDAWFRLVHKLPQGGVVDAAVLISDDRASTGLRDDGGAFQPLTTYGMSFQRARLRWQGPAWSSWRPEVILQVGPDQQLFQDQAELVAREVRTAIDGRAEVIGEDDRGWRLRMGVDVSAGVNRWSYEATSTTPEEQGHAGVFQPGLYIEPTVRLGPATLTTGLRADAFHLGRRHTSWAVDPRAALTVTLPHGGELRATVGRYSQPPSPRQVAPGATPTLVPAWALQSSLGLAWRVAEGVDLSVTGYVTPTFDVAVGREDRFRFLTDGFVAGPVDGGPYASVGRGLAGGVEIFLRAERPTWRAWLSATFGRSTVLGRREDEAVLSGWDQPYLINALGSVKLPKRWMIGARARVAAGTPYRPVEQRYHDTDLRQFVPLFADATTARLPPFFSLDLRVDKRWTLRHADVSLYLDVWNVTNTRNVEVIGWTWDWADERGILGLPILPAFGLKVDW